MAPRTAELAMLIKRLQSLARIRRRRRPGRQPVQARMGGPRGSMTRRKRRIRELMKRRRRRERTMLEKTRTRTRTTPPTRGRNPKPRIKARTLTVMKKLKCEAMRVLEVECSYCAAAGAPYRVENRIDSLLCDAILEARLVRLVTIEAMQRIASADIVVNLEQGLLCHKEVCWNIHTGIS